MGNAAARLNAGLLIGAQDVIARSQRDVLPHPGVQIHHSSGLLRELRVSREYPGAMPPRTQRIRVEPSPNRAGSDRLHDSFRQGCATNFRNGEPAQRFPSGGGQLTRDGLDLRDLPRGKKILDAPDGACLRAKILPAPSACATCGPSRRAFRHANQSRSTNRPDRAPTPAPAAPGGPRRKSRAFCAPFPLPAEARTPRTLAGTVAMVPTCLDALHKTSATAGCGDCGRRHQYLIHAEHAQVHTDL